MRPSDLVSSALLFAAASTAFSWPSSWQNIKDVKRDVANLAARATSFDLSYSSSEGQIQTSSAAATSGGSSAAATTGTGKQTGTAKTSDKGSGTKTTSKSAKTTVFDPRLPAGGVEMVTPSAIAGSEYYKIDDYVTFAWNYTSVSILPSYVDILASCSANQATYTIALNQSVSGPTGAVTWDTGAYQASATIPLLTETYTLIIHDAAKAISATAEAGYLGTWEQFTFGMYTPQPYTPIADWVCATCSGAMSQTERQTLGFMFGMVAVTVVSFTWFAGVAGLW